MADPKAHKTILLHSMLIPMCRLIPVPFLDDAVQEQLERRHVSEIAKVHGRQLSAQEILALCGHDGGGCSCWGCLVYVPLLPFKKLLRKILYFLEWKAAIDLAARTYIEAYALDHVLGQDLWPSEHPDPARRVHEALDNVVSRAGTSPIEGAFRSVLTNAKQGVLRTAGHLSQKLRKLTRLDKEAQKSAVTRALDELEVEEEERLEALLVKLTQALSQVHGEYFDKLRQLTVEEFKAPPDETTPSPTPPPPA